MQTRTPRDTYETEVVSAVTRQLEPTHRTAIPGLTLVECAIADQQNGRYVAVVFTHESRTGTFGMLYQLPEVLDPEGVGETVDSYAVEVWDSLLEQIEAADRGLPPAGSTNGVLWLGR